MMGVVIREGGSSDIDSEGNNFLYNNLFFNQYQSVHIGGHEFNSYVNSCSLNGDSSNDSNLNDIDSIICDPILDDNCYFDNVST